MSIPMIKMHIEKRHSLKNTIKNQREESIFLSKTSRLDAWVIHQLVESIFDSGAHLRQIMLRQKRQVLINTTRGTRTVVATKLHFFAIIDRTSGGKGA